MMNASPISIYDVEKDKEGYEGDKKKIPKNGKKCNNNNRSGKKNYSQLSILARLLADVDAVKPARRKGKERTTHPSNICWLGCCIM